jgi:hypothetical protein
MTGKQSRDLQRLFHIVAASALGVYIYSPLGENLTFAFVMKVVVFPALTITGLMMWKWTQIKRWFGISKKEMPKTGA